VGRDKDVCAAERVVSPVRDVVENVFNHCRSTEDSKLEQRYVRCVKKKEEAGKEFMERTCGGVAGRGEPKRGIHPDAEGHFY
jgi:hypothetical protein